MQPSPYTPGSIAREVPGRDDALGEIAERLSYLIDLQHLVERIRVDTGPRGLGKTSLLAQVQRMATQRGAATIWVVGGQDGTLPQAIGKHIGRLAKSWKSAPSLRAFLDAVTISGELGVPGVAKVQMSQRRPAAGRVDGALELQELLLKAAQMAGREGQRGLVLLIDEIQAADPGGLACLAHTWQNLQRTASDVPLAIFAAGLPDAAAVIRSAASFSERFAYRELSELSTAAVRRALTDPARALGVIWQPDALGAIEQTAQGYPFAVQLMADASWRAAGYPAPGGQITAEHAKAGIAEAQQDLAGLHQARWAEATTAEQRLLSAMATLGDGPVSRAEIAAALGVTSNSLSVARDRLIAKGVIRSAGHGRLRFAVTDFAAFVRDQQ